MATSVSQPGYFNLQGFTDLGALAVGGRVYTYTQGTTTKKNAYTEATGTTVHTYTSDGVGGEYIALNARGELPAPLYLTSGAYDITYKTAAGATVWTRVADTSIGSGGSALVGFLQAGTGAVDRTAQAKLRESVSVKDFGATGDGATDDTAAIQRAIDAVNTAGGGTVLIPPGYYVVSSTLNTYSFVNIIGSGTRYLYPSGGGSSLKFTSSTAAAACIQALIGTVGAEGYAQCRIANIGIDLMNSATYGIYLRGASNIEIDHCYILAQNSTNTNRAILFADVISSSVHHNHIVAVKYGLVSNDLFNNNTVYENNFDSLWGGHAIVLRQLTSGTGVQSTIRDNNFVNTVGSTCGSALVLQCGSQGMIFCNNTVESMTGVGVSCTNTDPIDGGTVASYNTGFMSHGNTFVAQPSYCITAEYCDAAVLGPDVNLSPPGPQVAMYSDANSSTGLVVNQGSSAGGKAVVLLSSLRPTSYVHTSKRYKATGTAMVAGTFQLSAGWGSTAAASVTTNSADSRWSISIQATGAGQAANPTITIVFADGTWTDAPFAVVTMNTGTGALIMPTVVITATQMVITYPATPTVNLYYGFNCVMVG